MTEEILSQLELKEIIDKAKDYKKHPLGIAFEEKQFLVIVELLNRIDKRLENLENKRS